ncbi:MAG: metallophosphoesterase [Endomicrobium sp.]|jgi:hypothetical protein|nr:metallophosphoesterase [Endomicrobium sp.]
MNMIFFKRTFCKGAFFKKIFSCLTAFVFLFSCIAPHNLNASSSASGAVFAIRNAVPKSAGYITDINISNSGGILIYIQDLHCNPEVQQNIASIITSIDNNIGIDKVILEGVPQGRVEDNVLQALPEEMKYKVVENLLAKGLVTGAEIYSVSENKKNIYGVENWDKYLENLYRASGLLKNKNYVLNSLKPFEKAVKENVKNSIGALSGLSSRDRNDKWYDDLLKAETRYLQYFYDYPDLLLYLELRQESGQINLKKVQKELEKYISVLKNTLSYKDYSKISENNANQPEYFEALYAIVEKSGDKGAFVKEYPNLYAFLNYSVKNNKINPLAIYAQEQSYIENIIARESVDYNKYEDITVFKMTSLLKSYFSLEMTAAEFDYFEQNLDFYKEILRAKYPSYRSIFYLLGNLEYLKYYWLNIERNDIFLETLYKYANDTPSGRVSIFVSGGFHTSLTDDLKERGISYALITPAVKQNFDSVEVYNRLIEINAMPQVLRNALTPIPFMLAAFKDVPQENRNVYFTQLIDSIMETADVRSPEALQTALENWAKNIGAIKSFSVSRGDKSFDIKINGQVLSFSLNNGKVDFAARQLFIPSAKKYKSVKAALNAAQIVFTSLHSAGKELTNKSLGMLLPKEYVNSVSGNEDFFFIRLFRYYYALSKIKRLDKMFNFKRKAYKFIEAVFDKSIKMKKAKEIHIDFKDGNTISVIIENDIAAVLESSGGNISAILERLIINAKEDQSFDGVPPVFLIGSSPRASHLFENYTGIGYITVNFPALQAISGENGIDDLASMNVRRAVLEAGIIHEISHEFNPKLSGAPLEFFEETRMMKDIDYIMERIMGIYTYEEFDGEDKDWGVYNEYLRDNIIVPYIEKILGASRFFDKFRRYEMSLDSVIKVVKENKSIPDSDLSHMANSYFVNSMKKHSEKSEEDLRKNEKHFYEQVILDQDKANISKKEEILSLLRTVPSAVSKSKKESEKEEYNREIISSINALSDKLGSILDSMSVPEGDINSKTGDINSKTKVFKDSIIDAIGLLAESLPESLFDRYFYDKTMTAGHALPHSLETLSYMLDILSSEQDKFEEIYGVVKMKTIVYSAMLHDLSCIISRNNHEFNSCIMIRKIFKNFPQGDIDIEKLTEVMLGHKKVKDNNHPRPEHEKYYIARLLHDADALDADMNFGRLYNMRKTMSLTTEILGSSIYNSSLKKEERIRLIKENKYLPIDNVDGINDFMRHFLRRKPEFYLTQGARNIIDSSKDKKELIDFIESRRSDMMAMGYTSRDVSKMINTIEEVLDYFNEISPQNPIDFNNKASAFTVKNRIYLLKQMFKTYFKKPTAYFKNVVVSDVHGGYERLVEVLSEVIGKEAGLTFDNATERIYEVLKKSNINALYSLGDTVDRGEYQLKALDLMINAHKSGKLRYIVGNHDLYALMNIMGVHLPFYRNYNGIDEDYKDMYGEVREFLKNKHKEDEAVLAKDRSEDRIRYVGKNEQETPINNAASRNTWAAALAYYMSIAAENQKKVWAAAFSKTAKLFEDVYEEQLDNKEGKDVLNSASKGKKNGRFKKDLSSEDLAALSDAQRNEYELNVRLRLWWAKILGHNVGVMVYTGLRAADKMSINWWKEMLEELEYLNASGQFSNEKEAYEKMKQLIGLIIETQTTRMIAETGAQITLSGDTADVNYADAWNQFLNSEYVKNALKSDYLRAAAENIIQAEKARIAALGQKAAAVKGNWMWRVLDAIMKNNYISTEWQALDWSFHKDWGGGSGGLISQRNKEIEAEICAKYGKPSVDKLTKLQKKELDIALLNSSSYFRDARIKSFAEFFKENFFFYRRDEYGTYYMHSMLPVDEYGDVAIGRFENGKVVTKHPDGKRIKGLDYKGVHYEGETIFDGFEAMAKDIRAYDIDKGDLSAIYEAFSIIISIYADFSTAIKPADIKNTHQKIGFSKIFSRMANGVMRLTVGHNPRNKTGSLGIHDVEFFGDRYLQILLAADDAFSKAYAKPKGKGTALIYSGELGIVQTGFESGEENAKILSRTLVKKNQFLLSSAYDICRPLARVFTSALDFFRARVSVFWDCVLLSLVDSDEINSKNTIVINMVIGNDSDVADNKVKMKGLTARGIKTIGIELSRASEGESEKLVLEQKSDDSSIDVVVRKDKQLISIKVPISYRYSKERDLNAQLHFVEVYVGFAAQNNIKAAGLQYDDIKDNILSAATAVFVDKMKQKGNPFEKYIKSVNHKRNVILRTSHLDEFNASLTTEQKHNNAVNDLIVAYESDNSNLGFSLSRGILNKSFNAKFESIMNSVYSAQNKNLAYFNYFISAPLPLSNAGALLEQNLSDTRNYQSVLEAA